MLTLPSSHAAGLLQVVWKSLTGVGILARIWVLAISVAKTQVRVHCGTESYQVSAQACIILYIWGQKEAFSSTQLEKYIGDMFFNFSWYLSHVASQPSYQTLLSSLLCQEQDNGIASAISCCLHLPCESCSLWSFQLGVKFMRGIWRCFGACGEVQHVDKKWLRMWEINLLQHFLLIAED